MMTEARWKAHDARIERITIAAAARAYEMRRAGKGLLEIALALGVAEYRVGELVQKHIWEVIEPAKKAKRVRKAAAKRGWKARRARIAAKKGWETRRFRARFVSFKAADWKAAVIL